MNIEITEGVINTRHGYMCSGSGGPGVPHAPTKPPAPEPEPADDDQGEDEGEQDEDTK